MRLLFFLVVLSVLGCAGGQNGSKVADPNDHPVERRAPFEMDCPREALRFHKLDPKTIGVSGCGRRLTYVKVCRQKAKRILLSDYYDLKEECQWVANTALSQ